jgi:parallel beta-helix repeat protein
MHSLTSVHFFAALITVLLFASPVIAQQITPPYTITSPGTYALGSDCIGSVPLRDCSITISASDVTLDGKGHAIIESGIIVKKDGPGMLSGITIRDLWVEGGRTAILLSGTDRARISNVTVVETVSDGLKIERSKDVSIENSAFLKNVDLILDPVYENAYHGGILLAGTENVVITGCTFEDHVNAIVLLDADNTTISSNYFHNNRDIMCHSAEGTKIFNNYLSVVGVAYGKNINVLNTTLQVKTNIIGGEKTGGNYWYQSDGSGYSQTCVDNNHSGICDKPYEIPGPPAFDVALRTDYLPLCGPMVSDKPVHPAITPKVMHTVPTAAVYHQISPTPNEASLSFSIIILGAVIGIIALRSRR